MFENLALQPFSKHVRNEACRTLPTKCTIITLRTLSREILKRFSALAAMSLYFALKRRTMLLEVLMNFPRVPVTNEKAIKTQEDTKSLLTFASIFMFSYL